MDEIDGFCQRMTGTVWLANSGAIALPGKNMKLGKQDGEAGESLAFR
jgi:hypothetical protein